jgi:hypothetical protein
VAKKLFRQAWRVEEKQLKSIFDEPEILKFTPFTDFTKPFWV